MKSVYLDNGSTTYPKPKQVAEQVSHFIQNVGCNVGRGGYAGAFSAAEVVFETRTKLAELFHFDRVQNVVLSPSVTYSLNFILKGLLRPGDHVLVTSMEHNAVMRPLVQLQKQGVTFDRMPCDSEGMLELDKVEQMIRPNTRAIVMMHSSNVCGTVMPAQQVGDIAKKHGLHYILDVAQTAGVLPIDMKAMHIDALTFTGHKGLLGPQGIGGFLITDGMAAEIDPLVAGGTGSISDSEETPDFLPDKFEPGTLNLPGIYGLHAALSFLEEQGIETIHAGEQALTKRFLEGLHAFGEKLQVVGRQGLEDRVAVVSIDIAGRDNAEVAFLLDSQYGIMTRVGMHCAPSAHKTLGTFPTGTIRFSFGHWNTEEEIDYALECLHKILD